MEQEEEKKNNLKFNEKLVWLRKLKPDELGINQKLMPLGYVHKEYEPRKNTSSGSSGSTPLQAPSSPMRNAAALPTLEQVNEALSSDVSRLSRSASSSSSSSSASVSASSSAFSPFSLPSTSTSFPPSRDRPTSLSSLPPYVPIVPDSFPYSSSINLLSRLDHDHVPTDMFFRIVSSVRMIYVEAKEYAKQHREAEIEEAAMNAAIAAVEAAKERERKEEEEAMIRAVAAAEAREAAATAAAAEAASNSSLFSSSSIRSIDALSPDASVSPGLSETRSLLGFSGSAENSPRSRSASARVVGIVAPSSSAAGAAAAASVPFAIAPPPLPPPPSSSSSSSSSELHSLFNADNIFPLITWLVIHSNLSHISTCLGHLDRFLSAESKQFGEAGMCLSLVEAAVYHVLQVTQEQVQQEANRMKEEKEMKKREKENGREENGEKKKGGNRSSASVSTSSSSASRSSSTDVFDPILALPPRISTSSLSGSTATTVHRSSTSGSSTTVSFGSSHSSKDFDLLTG